jgi:hypothetical protein
LKIYLWIGMHGKFPSGMCILPALSRQAML